MKRATYPSHRQDKQILISIHALVKTATGYSVEGFHFRLISIHALVKRATAPYPHIQFEICISIHALVKRATILRISMQKA